MHEAEGERCRRVIVMDSSATVTLMICGLLRRWGLQAEQASALPPMVDGLECDLLIVDPGVSDARLAVLRARVPWLALVSHGSPHDTADASGWVHKPIAAEELHASVFRCLDARQVSQPTEGIDVAAIDAAWGGVTNAGFARVVRAFVDELEHNLLTMAQALADGDRPRLQIEAHSVVGSSGNVGATAMAQAARQLENAATRSDLAQLGRLLDTLVAASRRDLPVLRGFIGD